MKKSVIVMLLLMAATSASGEIYTWKDARGNAHYTNSLHEIPARFLKKARVLDVATGKLGAPATAAKPAQAPATGATGQQPATMASPATAAAPHASATMVPAPAVPSAAVPNGIAPPQPPVATNAPPPPTRDRMSRRRARASRVEEE